MSRAARLCAVGVAALAVSLGLAACGGAQPSHTARVSSPLCIDVLVPLTGPQASVGHALLSGLAEKISAAEASMDGRRLRLCAVRNTAGPPVTTLRDAIAVSADPRTVAVVGGLDAAQAGDLDAVLAAAGISLISPSAPPEPNSSTVRSTPDAAGAVDGAAGVAEATSAPARTQLSLLPASATASAAVAEVLAGRGCAGSRHRGAPPRCLLEPRPLCSGGPVTPEPVEVGGAGTVTASDATGRVTRPAPASVPVRVCVLGGEAAAGPNQPAVAFGAAAGEIILTAMRRIADEGTNATDRRTIHAALLRTTLTTSPIGPIHFDPAGAIESDTFTSYTVRPDGSLTNAQTFSTHRTSHG